MLFAPASVVQHLVDTQGVLSPAVVDFDTKTTIADWLGGRAADWIRRAPNLSDYDVVVSDNLVETLLLRPDAWLSGSFFWHDSLSGLPAELGRQAERLLDTFRPRMISSRLFTSDRLGEKTRLHEVGLFAGEVQAGERRARGRVGGRAGRQAREVLISAGRGGPGGDWCQAFVRRLAERGPGPFPTVWMDPPLLPASPPDWMHPASFGQRMYQDLLSAVIRPGAGTVTDALLAGARVFAFFEEGNGEMETNARHLEQENLGKSCGSIESAWEKAVEYAGDTAAQGAHERALANLDTDGAAEAARLLLGDLGPKVREGAL